jgi:hypothetical protein
MKKVPADLARIETIVPRKILTRGETPAPPPRVLSQRRQTFTYHNYLVCTHD